MLVADERDQRASGRTTSALDDRYIRLLHSVHPAVVVLLTLVVCAGWGLALPALLGGGEVSRLIFITGDAIFAAAVGFAWLLPVVEARLRHQRLELTTDLRTLSAREFEGLAGELFRREGWNVTETGGHGTPDGHIDLILSRSSECRIVQCKRWTARDVGVDQIRELGGTLLREGRAGHEGIFVTCARFTPAALTEATELGIEVIDGRELVRRLETIGAVGLLKAAKHLSSVWLCSECATPMVLAHSPHGWWLKCPNYNVGCRGKHDLGQDSRAALERLITGA